MFINGITGDYFIRGQYIAMRAGDGGPWNVSKVEHHKDTAKVVTLTLVGQWWTREDAANSIDWHTRRDREDAAFEHATGLVERGHPVPVPKGWDSVTA